MADSETLEKHHNALLYNVFQLKFRTDYSFFLLSEHNVLKYGATEYPHTDIVVCTYCAINNFCLKTSNIYEFFVVSQKYFLAR